MRYSIGLTRLPLPQFAWASIDKRVETPPLAPAETVIETAAKEDDNV
jgi:hypothetical protein